MEMLRHDLEEKLKADGEQIPVLFISAVAQMGLDELKDVLWQELNSESNKLQTITAEDTLVHRDKEMSQFARELLDEGEDGYIPDEDEEEVYTIVSTMRQDSLKGLISVESPLGKALLKHKAGDTITVRVSKDYSYQAVIRKVEESQEAEDASLRNY